MPLKSFPFDGCTNEEALPVKNGEKEEDSAIVKGTNASMEAANATAKDNGPPRRTSRSSSPSRARKKTSSTPKGIIMLLFAFATTCLALLLQIAAASNAETLVGIVGPDFVMLGADTNVAQNIVVTSSHMDKIYTVHHDNNSHHGNRHHHDPVAVAAASGDIADVKDLISFLQEKAAIQAHESSSYIYGRMSSDVEVISLADEGDKGTIPAAAVTLPAGGLSVTAVAKLARSCISQRLRSRAPYQVRLLVAGMQHERPASAALARLETGKAQSYLSGEVQQQIQEASSPFVVSIKQEEPAQERSNMAASSSSSTSSTLRPCLYWLDEYGSLQRIRYASHGLGSNFLLAILDENYQDNLSREQAAQLIHKCFRQLQTRYIINSPKPPLVKCVDSKGCHVYEIQNESEVDP